LENVGASIGALVTFVLVAPVAYLASLFLNQLIGSLSFSPFGPPRLDGIALFGFALIFAVFAGGASAAWVYERLRS